MREYHYVVDDDGRIFHDGTEIVDVATLRFFLRVMTRTPDGRWLAVCQGEQNWFQARETPFVVQRLRLEGEGPDVRAIDLHLAGDVREPLDPATLESDAGRLYCRVRGGAFRALFGRLALQQLAPLLTDDGGGPMLVIDGRRHPIRMLVPAR